MASSPARESSTFHLIGLNVTVELSPVHDHDNRKRVRDGQSTMESVTRLATWRILGALAPRAEMTVLRFFFFTRRLSGMTRLRFAIASGREVVGSRRRLQRQRSPT